MHTIDELEVLRRAYAEALLKYEAVSASLSRHVIAGTKPSTEELHEEEQARAALNAARSRFLDAWRLTEAD